METARAMLYDQDIPMNLWVEAAITAVYVQNYTPHRVLENKILKKSSPARNQKSATSEYSAVQYTYIFQNKREQN